MWIVLGYNLTWQDFVDTLIKSEFWPESLKVHSPQIDGDRYMSIITAKDGNFVQETDQAVLHLWSLLSANGFAKDGTPEIRYILFSLSIASQAQTTPRTVITPPVKSGTKNQSFQFRLHSLKPEESDIYKGI